MQLVTEKFIEQHWPLHGVRFGRILQGLDNRTVHEVDATEGKFILKVPSGWTTEVEARQHTSVFSFLLKKGFTHIPRIIATKSEQQFQKVGSQFCYLLERIIGNEPEPRETTYQRLGELTAELHTFQDYPYTSLYPIEKVRGWLEDRAQSLSFRDEYLAIANGLPNFSLLPTSLTHGEIGPHNAVVDQESGNLVILDWDEAGNGPRILDLAFPLIMLFVSEDLVFDELNAKAFYSGYFSKRVLTEQEHAIIFDAALLLALLYITYGDIKKRWQRIHFALNHKEQIISVVKK